MNKMIKLCLSISVLSCAVSMFAAEDLQSKDWRAVVRETIASRKFNAGLAGVGTAAVVTALCANAEEIKKPVVATWNDVQEEWVKAQKTKISRGTVARTALAVAGVTATGIAGKSLYDAIDKEAVKSYVTQKMQESKAWFENLSTPAKVGVLGSATALSVATTYGLFKAYQATKKHEIAELTPLEELKQSLSVDLLNELAIADINSDVLFATASEQPTVLLYETEFYNRLSESQKILVGLVIQMHESENLL